ncbi:hypothetical protein BATDEDRAFT_90522 [Batrachochytrium dendrobatidis JAM81]|uniref:Secreted protein n=1 Tax=Batrachochytrium dendrobatidis (strain JAM81 / FGSC 10211) TaxID=684364 RepID=F4P8C5_BATDJ|nr:uncharacterized protein BATDEDRAFT_90522 [Batrachochytrium dendrobatidis JAM81]EGF78782.1 hypothetical protein BATDEDRAFT_90522 [Batrachochytrium dendrobatidis JAM81]|eukprot:XP_006680970.1 hypothetical protein BATDEDRAFT_90522 [Batrachochytrium dendrobatidis JAM81]
MKFSIAVLSSILAVCSVTVSNPVDPSESTDDEDGISTFIPSATTSTEDNTFTGIPTVFKGVEYNFWIDANPDGIGLGALDDPLSGNVKHLLDKYAEIQDGRNQQSKIYWPLKSRYDSQYDVVLGFKKDLKVLEYLSQDDDSLKYYIEIRKTKLDHEKQLSKLDKIRKSFDECQFKIGLLWETDKKIVRLIFGTPLDVVTVIYKSSLIKETPSVNDYIEKQSLKYESIDQKSGGRRKRKDLESSDEESDEELDEESGYKFNRKGTFSMRRASSKFITRFGSFFQKSRRDDPSN